MQKQIVLSYFHCFHLGAEAFNRIFVLHLSIYSAPHLPLLPPSPIPAIPSPHSSSISSPCICFLKNFNKNENMLTVPPTKFPNMPALNATRSRERGEEFRRGEGGVVFQSVWRVLKVLYNYLKNALNTKCPKMLLIPLMTQNVMLPRLPYFHLGRE